MLSLNWVDYLILFIFALYAYGGYSGGFVSAFFSLVNFVLSFLIGLKFYSFVAGMLLSQFSLPPGVSDAIGFFIVTLLAEIIIGALVQNLLFSNLLGYLLSKPVFKSLDKMLGIFPNFLSGVILVSFVLILIVALPVANSIKRPVLSSRIGNFLLANAQGLERNINHVFGGAINETIAFLTVEPKGNELVSLNFKTNRLLNDPQSEKEMFNSVNKERLSRGVGALVFDNALRDVGRAHCEDMFKRGYFSHYTPEGLSPFDRMDQAGIEYLSAGENLALSPNTEIAMQGLMNSPGHKANILSSNFGKVGVGVIDGGIYGEMFCQEFSD